MFDFSQYYRKKIKILKLFQYIFDVLGDSEMRNLKKGDVIQISRRGYYICDKEFKPAASKSSK